jgi:hypothetical protein
MITQRVSKPVQAGVRVLVRQSKFTPTPSMAAGKIAFHKGREARRLGKPETINPHDPASALGQKWLEGYRA